MAWYRCRHKGSGGGVTPIGDAVQGDELFGKTFTNATDVGLTGTMTNNGAVNITLDTSTTSYTVPEGYHNGSGTVNISTETPTITAGTSASTTSATSGKVISSVTVNPTPSQTKSATPSLSSQTITPDSGNLLSSVTVAGITPNRTTNSMIVPKWGIAAGNSVPATEIATRNPRIDFNNTSTYGSAEMVEVAMPQGYYAWSYGNSSCCIPTETKTVTATTSAQTVTPTGYNTSGQYVKYLKSVTINPQTHSGTYTFATNDTGGTKDLGEKHTYRYVNASNVYAKGKADGAALSLSNIGFSTLGNGQRGNVSVGLTMTNYTYMYIILCRTNDSAAGNPIQTNLIFNSSSIYQTLVSISRFSSTSKTIKFSYNGAYWQCTYVNATTITIASSGGTEYIKPVAVFIKTA